MLHELAQILGRSRNAVFFGGAGVSTESGIPDFRSESGLYKARRVYGHAPEQIISRPFFESDPDTFYAYYRENLLYPDAAPNAAHRALARLEEQGRLSAVVTQNIDGLHQRAGSKTVWELHGSTLRSYCTDCGEKHSLEYILHPEKSRGHIPLCAVCGGIVRPDVVLYGESLDESVVDGAVDAISGADTLLVGGTSLAVYPAAGMLRHFQGDKLVLINKSSTPFDGQADLVIHDAIGAVLGKVMNALS